MEKVTLSALPNDLNALKVLNKQLLEKIAQLETEIAELKRRLGLDSTNSHKPPSSDGYAKKTVKPGSPKEGKEKGGQKGHHPETDGTRSHKGSRARAMRLLWPTVYARRAA